MMIQVAGVHDWNEAQLILNAGATHLGFPLRLPVNREDCTESEARDIIARMPDASRAVLITYMNEAQEIIDFCRLLQVTMVQLHGEISLGCLQQLKTMRPEIRIIKSLVVGKFSEDQLLQAIQAQQAFVDFFITDTFNPKTGASGATGLTHDWSLGQRLVAASSKPVIIAGGLNRDNVAQAVTHMRPYGVDVHSGVEGPDGRKRIDLVTDFCARAKVALAAL
jgi:phosphoribosylanthranilate isomerase